MIWELGQFCEGGEPNPMGDVELIPTVLPSKLPVNVFSYITGSELLSRYLLVLVCAKSKSNDTCTPNGNPGVTVTSYW